MKTFDEGQIYFISPYEVSSQTKKIKPMSADVTYLTTGDSVTLNVSVWAPQELQADSLVLRSGNHVYCRNFRTFFVESDGKQWLHRYSMQFPLASWSAIYSASSPFTLCVYAGEQTITYGYSDKGWPKEQDWMNQILHIIASNKRLYNQK